MPDGGRHFITLVKIHYKHSSSPAPPPPATTSEASQVRHISIYNATSPHQPLLLCCVQEDKVAAAPAYERRDTTRAKRGANTTLNVATAYKRRRVKWTPSELAFVREWATQNQPEQGKRWRWTECVAAGQGILHAAHAAGGNVKDAAKRLGLVREQQSEEDTAASRPAVVVLPASHDTASSSAHSN